MLKKFRQHRMERLHKRRWTYYLLKTAVLKFLQDEREDLDIWERAELEHWYDIFNWEEKRALTKAQKHLRRAL